MSPLCVPSQSPAKNKKKNYQTHLNAQIIKPNQQQQKKNTTKQSQVSSYSHRPCISRRLAPRRPSSSRYQTPSGGPWSPWPPSATVTWGIPKACRQPGAIQCHHMHPYCISALSHPLYIYIFHSTTAQRETHNKREKYVTISDRHLDNKQRPKLIKAILYFYNRQQLVNPVTNHHPNQSPILYIH